MRNNEVNDKSSDKGKQLASIKRDKAALDTEVKSLGQKIGDKEYEQQ